MGDDDEARPLLPVQFQQQRIHAFRRLSVQVSGWLIRQHTRRVGYQRTRNCRALPFATRKFGRLVAGARTQTDTLQQRHRARRRLGDRYAAYQQRHRNVLQGGELRQQVVKLVDEADGAITHQTPAFLVHCAEGAPLQGNLAGSRPVQTTETVHQRALARTRGPDDGNLFGAFKREIDIAQYFDPTRPGIECLGQTLAGQHGRVTHNAVPLPVACDTRATPAPVSSAD